MLGEGLGLGAFEPIAVVGVPLYGDDSIHATIDLTECFFPAAWLALGMKIGRGGELL